MSMSQVPTVPSCLLSAIIPESNLCPDFCHKKLLLLVCILLIDESTLYALLGLAAFAQHVLEVDP